MARGMLSLAASVLTIAGPEEHDTRYRLLQHGDLNAGRATKRARLIQAADERASSRPRVDLRRRRQR